MHMHPACASCRVADLAGPSQTCDVDQQIVILLQLHRAESLWQCSCLRTLSRTGTGRGVGMSTTLAVTVLGSVALVAIALLVGLIERHGQHRAWTRIARRRRELAAWERELRTTTEAGLCSRCRRPRRPDQFEP